MSSDELIRINPTESRKTKRSEEKREYRFKLEKRKLDYKTHQKK